MRSMILMIALTAGLVASAQDADDLRVVLKDFKQETVSWSDNYPDMNLRGLGSGGGRGWKRLAIKLDVVDRKADRNQDTWVDDLEFRWNLVLALGRNGLDNPSPKSSIRFTRTIKYVNVRASDRGIEYWVMIFIPPEVFQRYGKRDDVPDERILGRVDVVWGRKNLGTVWFQDGKAEVSDRIPNRTLNDYVISEDPRPMPYGILHRLETPWAFSSSDNEKVMRIAPDEQR